MYYKKFVKYKYFIKKMFDYYNIPCDIKVKKHKIYENIWNDFTYKYEKKVKFNKRITIHEIPYEERINYKFIDKQKF